MVKPAATAPQAVFFCFTPRGALLASALIFFALFMVFADLRESTTTTTHSSHSAAVFAPRTFFPGVTLRPKDQEEPDSHEYLSPVPVVKKGNRKNAEESLEVEDPLDGKKTVVAAPGGHKNDLDNPPPRVIDQQQQQQQQQQQNVMDDVDETPAPAQQQQQQKAVASSSLSWKYPFRHARLQEAQRKPNLDPDITEWPHEDELEDQPRYNVSGGRNFISHLEWKGKCWYEVTNFCVVQGDLVLYHDPASQDGGKSVKRDSLRMCTEFSQRSPLIRLKYRSEPAPAVLPGPLLENTPGWILQFWCQDLFHSTLSLMPAFQTKLAYFKNKHPDVYLRIARGRRKKGQYCHIKYGHPLSYNESHNKRWGNDKQFPFAGNPYWSMYGVLSKDPWRMHPLYSGATKKTACYKTGVIDKLYVKDVTRKMARQYSDAMLENLNVTKAKPRECGKYRMTIIDRRGKTRRLTNIPAIVDIAKNKIGGFVEVRAVAFEFLTLQQQIALVTDTDLLLGVHGNGLIWQQFMQQGACLIELVHTWYMPYAKLFGHSYFHSSIKKNPFYKQNGEFVPFAHNETEIEELLFQAKAALDRTSCPSPADAGGAAAAEKVDMDQKLDYMYSGCAPHC